jgi:acetyl-CoA carboxylase biotin carboxyl carrier protein
MIDMEFLERLIRAIDESTLDSIEIERGGTRLRLAKSPPPQPIVTTAGNGGGISAPQAPAEIEIVSGDGGSDVAEAEPEAVVRENLVEITSPMVGTFYRAPAPDTPVYTEVGNRISQGDVLCIIEAMKLMNELESEISGVIVEICVENAEPVEYGQVLFRVEES